MFIPGLHLFTALPVTIQRVGSVLRGQGMRRESSSWRVKLCRLSQLQASTAPSVKWTLEASPPRHLEAGKFHRPG